LASRTLFGIVAWHHERPASFSLTAWVLFPRWWCRCTSASCPSCSGSRSKGPRSPGRTPPAGSRGGLTGHQVRNPNLPTSAG